MVRFSQLNLIKNRVTILLHQIPDPVTPYMENLGENRVTVSMLVIVGMNHSGRFLTVDMRLECSEVGSEKQWPELLLGQPLGWTKDGKGKNRKEMRHRALALHLGNHEQHRTVNLTWYEMHTNSVEDFHLYSHIWKFMKLLVSSGQSQDHFSTQASNHTDTVLYHAMEEFAINYKSMFLYEFAIKYKI
jgi:hypothetical protein